MPWMTDPNGERQYRPSIYAKEELPTWAEVYEEFYRCHRFYYDPSLEDGQMLDQYWRIPRLKVLLATVCNQFNKMLFEDGMRNDALKFISRNILDGATDVRFTCELVEPYDYYRIMNGSPVDTDRLHEGYLENWSTAITTANVGTNAPHPIYTIPLPTGEPNPFILNSSMIERRDITKLSTVMCVHPMILFKGAPLKSADSKIYTPRPFDPLQADDWQKVIDFMMKDIKEYFEGDGVGWKDENGKLIDSPQHPKKCLSGTDPAL